jgi:hypothetical protein
MPALLGDLRSYIRQIDLEPRDRHKQQAIAYFTIFFYSLARFFTAYRVSGLQGVSRFLATIYNKKALALGAELQVKQGE